MHGILRVAGRHRGRTGYWQSDPAAPRSTPWRFRAPGRPLSGRPLRSPRADTSAVDLAAGEDHR